MMTPALKYIILNGTRSAYLRRAVIRTFADGEQGWWYDPTDITTLFQDAAGTVPVTASGDPVRLMLDKSGRGNHATAPSDAARPVYTVSGSQRYLVSSAATSAMVTASIDLTASAQISLAAGLLKASDAAAYQVVLELSANYGSNSGAFALFASANAGASRFVAGGNAGAVARYKPNVFAANAPGVLACKYAFGGALIADEIFPRFNSTLVQIAPFGTDCGAGNLGNYALYLFARAGSSSRFGGNFYGSIGNARPTGLTAQEMSTIEQYVNLNTGATLA